MPSLDYEFFGAIIGTMWLFLFAFVFQLLAPESLPSATVVSEKSLLDEDVREAGKDDEDGELYKWWWWITHNLLIVLGLGVGYAAELIVQAPLCVSFGVTMLGWAVSLPFIFIFSIVTKKGLDYYNAVRQAPIDDQKRAINDQTSGKYKAIAVYVLTF